MELGIDDVRLLNIEQQLLMEFLHVSGDGTGWHDVLTTFASIHDGMSVPLMGWSLWGIPLVFADFLCLL